MTALLWWLRRRLAPRSFRDATLFRSQITRHR